MFNVIEIVQVNLNASCLCCNAEKEKKNKSSAPVNYIIGKILFSIRSFAVISRDIFSLARWRSNQSINNNLSSLFRQCSFILGYKNPRESVCLVPSDMNVIYRYFFWHMTQLDVQLVGSFVFMAIVIAFFSAI